VFHYELLDQRSWDSRVFGYPVPGRRPSVGVSFKVDRRKPLLEAEVRTAR